MAYTIREIDRDGTKQSNVDGKSNRMYDPRPPEIEPRRGGSHYTPTPCAPDHIKIFSSPVDMPKGLLYNSIALVTEMLKVI